MYSAKVSNSMTVDNKTGKVRLDEFEVKVNGFDDKALTEKAKNNYNSDKSIPESEYDSRWPEGTWYDMYLKMMKNFLKWKQKKIY